MEDPKEHRQAPVAKPWAKDPQEVLRALDVDENGLGASQVEDLRSRYGPNVIRSNEARPTWRILVDQVKNLIAALLTAAALLSFAFGQWLDGASVLVALALNVLIGFFTELRAVRSMEALSRLGQTKATVRRDGRSKSIPAEKLVPGDLVLLEAGDVVPADLRIIKASRAQADESALTGESMPVGKNTDSSSGDESLGDRVGMLFKGTTFVQGSAEGVSVATGMDTELGRIASLAEGAGDDKTPLEHRLERLGQRLIWVTLGLAVAVAVTGLLRGRDPLLIVKTAVALCVAAIPEGLPIVATIALARGMWRLAKRNALIRRLSAVETLGTTSVVCTDKTGTLTENHMTVTSMLVPAESGQGREIAVETAGQGFTVDGQALSHGDSPALKRMLTVAALCNSVDGEEGKRRADPMERALVEVAELAEMSPEELLNSIPETGREAFDPDVKMMATIHDRDGHSLALIKGAPEAVLEACTVVRTDAGERELTDEEREWWLDRNGDMAGDGLRLLAAADNLDPGEDVYSGMAFLGLYGFMDPPRPEAAEAVAQCRAAGVRVVMVTGDQAGTAVNVARSLGFAGNDETGIPGSDLEDAAGMSDEERKRVLAANVFYRVSPEQKLNLVTLFQEDGAITAMTGDGVNDAPALKKADIGVAMGRRGTQAARDAADMVLKDDAFASIVTAMEQGRGIFENIRKFILYLLSGNAGEIMIVTVALLLGMPLPLLPLQILYLNMLSDIFPALALGVGHAEAGLMDRPPRRASEPILTRSHWLAVFGYGGLIAASVLAAFVMALEWLELPPGAATTASFLTLAFARQWHVFNMRDRGTRAFSNSVVRNKWVWGAVGLCFALLGAAVYVPALALVLKIVPPAPATWGVIVGMSLIPLVVGQALKLRKGGDGD